MTSCAARPSSIIEGKQQFAFTHGLIRDVAYELLPRAERARRHAVVAEFFERVDGRVGRGDRRAGPSLARRGRQRTRGRAAVRAAEQAERGWAKDHAALLYREALELVPAEDAERRMQLRRRLALASAASFHLTDVRRAESLPA